MSGQECLNLVCLLLQRIFPQGEEPSGETDLKNLVRGLGSGTVGLQGQGAGSLMAEKRSQEDKDCKKVQNLGHCSLS